MTFLFFIKKILQIPIKIVARFLYSPKQKIVLIRYYILGFQSFFDI